MNSLDQHALESLKAEMNALKDRGKLEPICKRSEPSPEWVGLGRSKRAKLLRKKLRKLEVPKEPKEPKDKRVEALMLQEAAIIRLRAHNMILEQKNASLLRTMGNLKLLRYYMDDALSAMWSGDCSSTSVSVKRRQIVWDWYKLEFVTGREACQCCHCGKLLTQEEFTVEHLKPKILGGGDEIDNLRPSCNTCNSERPVEDISHLHNP